MYETFFGLKQKPFQLNPDPRFYYDSPQHHRAMAFIRYGLHQGEGFVVITSEVGAGKTTLVRSVLGAIDERRIHTANIVSTQLAADDLLRVVATSFGVRTRDMAKSDVLLSLEGVLTSHAKTGKRCLLIVDEAQNLEARAVEELRMLSNFQIGSHALLQTFLIGQPEFRSILMQPDLDQLRQRVIAACHIGPLDAEDTRRYVEHRLRHVGWNGQNPQILAEAFGAIHEASDGIPRRINLVSDRSLLSAFLADSRLVTADLVRQISHEIGGETSLAVSQFSEQRGFTEPIRPKDVLGMTTAGNVRTLDPVKAAAAPPPSAAHEATEMENELRTLRESVVNMEKNNQATIKLFRRMLEWVRSQDGRPGDPH